MRRLVALLACAGATLSAVPGPARAAAPPADAQVLFATAFSTPAGQPATLAELRGRPLIVNFWARWCMPCRTEIPELARAQRRHRAIGIVGIDLDEQPDAVGEFARAYAMNYRVLVTRGDGIELLRTLGNASASLPFTIAIDGRGTIVGSRLGVMRRADLDALLRRLR